MAWVDAEVWDPARYDEIVLCGFGEPLLRFAEVKEIAGALNSRIMPYCPGRIMRT